VAAQKKPRTTDAARAQQTRAPHPSKPAAGKPAANKPASKSAASKPSQPKPSPSQPKPSQPKPSQPKRPTPKTVDPRSGRVAIVGRPNVGKSTLLNALLGQKLAIATSKPGTTRTVLLGVVEHRSAQGELTQLALLDTPGLEQPRSVLGRALVEEAQGALDGVDAVLLLIDVEDALRKRTLPGGLDLADARILDAVKAHGAPFVIALNKVDRIKDKPRLFPLLEKLQQTSGAKAIIPISAMRAQGIDGVVSELRAFLRPGLSFEEGTLTDKPERYFVAELLREAILERTHEEVPHGIAVGIEEWVDEGKHLRIGCTIVVDKEGHKGIVIGARGQMLKEIGEAARAQMEDFLGRHVFLRTFVKVVPGWTKDEGAVRRAVREGAP
jgi:GTP-binding protein Era